jgi:hypothetical protein
VGGNGVRAYIYTVPVYYAAPGCQYTLYGTYFVTQYANGFEDWSEVNSVQNALSASGYWSQHGSGTFWRTIYN